MIKQLIQSLGLSNASVSAIVTALNAKTVLNTRSELLSWAGVGKYSSFELAIQLRYLVKSLIASSDTPTELKASLDYAYSMLEDTKMDFSLDSVQNLLESMREFFADQGINVDIIKAIGKWYESPYQSNGGTGDVSPEQVQSALGEIEREKLVYSGNTVLAQFHAAINAWQPGQPKPALVLGVE